MAEQHLRPGPSEDPLGGATEPPFEPEADFNPWEHRRTLGWWRALWQTSWLFLRHPLRAYNSTLGRGGFRGPLLFALLVSFIGGFFAELFDALYQLAIPMLTIIFPPLMGARA